MFDRRLNFFKKIVFNQSNKLKVHSGIEFISNFLNSTCVDRFFQTQTFPSPLAANVRTKNVNKLFHVNLSSPAKSYLVGDKMPKEQFREADVIKKISHVSFCIDSAQEIQQTSHLQVKQKNLYNQDQKRTPVQNGVLDRRMGVSQKGTICETCNQGLNECVGHFGYLDLALPVFHVGHFRATVTILQTMCKTCSRVMLKVDDAKMFSKRLMNPNLSYLAKKSIHQQVCGETSLQNLFHHSNVILGSQESEEEQQVPSLRRSERSCEERRWLNEDRP